MEISEQISDNQQLANLPEIGSLITSEHEEKKIHTNEQAQNVAAVISIKDES